MANRLKVIAMPTKKSEIKVLPAMEKGICPTHPKNCLFSGMPGSGKSNLMAWMLKNFYTLPNGKLFWDRVFYFSPTMDDMLLEYVPENNRFPDCDPEDLKSIVDKINQDIKKNGIAKSGKNLFIFDDVISEKKLLNSYPFRRCFVSNRHINASTWIGTQKFHAVPRTCRVACSYHFIFNPCRTEIKRITSEFQSGKLTERQFDELVMEACTKEPYSFLFISLCGDIKQRFKMGFDRVITIDS